MKKITYLFLPIITLALCAPLAAMEKIEKMEKGEMQKPLEQYKLVVKTDPKVLQSFGAIYTPKKKTVEVDENKQQKKDENLKEKFVAFSEHFFGLASPQEQLCKNVNEKADKLVIKKPLDCTGLVEKVIGLTTVMGKTVKNWKKNNKKQESAQEIVDLTLEAIKKHPEPIFAFLPSLEQKTASQQYAKFLAKIPVSKKIRMLHFGDYMLAPSPFLIGVAEDIHAAIKQNPKLYEEHKNEIEACTFQIVENNWEKSETTYDKPDLVKQCEDAKKSHDDFVAASSTANALETKKTFSMGTKSRVLTVNRDSHTGTFVFKDNGTITATHKLENINSLIDVTPLSGAGYVFCDGINGKKNCIINLTTGAYYCVTTDNPYHWPEDMVNAHFWLPEEIPGHVTTRIHTKKVELALPKKLVKDRGSKEPKVEREFLTGVEKTFTRGEFQIITKTNNQNSKVAIQFQCKDQPETATNRAVIADAHFFLMKNWSRSFVDPSDFDETSFISDFRINKALYSHPDGATLVVDEDVEGVHTYHTLKRKTTQTPFAEWLKKDSSRSIAMGMTKEDLQGKKQQREDLMFKISIIGSFGAGFVGAAIGEQLLRRYCKALTVHIFLPIYSNSYVKKLPATLRRSLVIDSMWLTCKAILFGIPALCALGFHKSKPAIRNLVSKRLHLAP